ncbi:hypothetical protein IWQ60_007111 [Tieghemiomyces parasiticus]|uniref:peptidyl-tRNA hydrolase n=1 Tax=Tieghemiomyces parasiticus TaxID=78921 RepID=A0A9W8DVG6_9FUNG|nr:hypothetical protein IWQ60_007111 [Tieghemiomyces parasiticus]
MDDTHRLASEGISLHLIQLLAMAVAGVFCGYIYGRTGRHHAAQPSRAPQAGQASDDSGADSDLQDHSDDDDVPAEDCKLALVIQKDLGMTKGKVAAQCCHATLGCYKRARRQNPRALRAWEYAGQAKITLKGESEEAMQELQACAESLGLTTYFVQDAGRTQIAAGSRTVLGIGPGPVDVINQVTGHLKLY